MLTADMKFIGADIDTTHCYQERVHGYEEKWNAIMAGKKGNASPADLGELMERELTAGFRPREHYAKEPFRSITRLMDKHELSTTELGAFLKWRVKDDNLKAARAAKS